MFEDENFWTVIVVVFMVSFSLGFWVRGKSLNRRSRTVGGKYNVVEPKRPKVLADDEGIKYRPPDLPEIKIEPPPKIEIHEPPFPKSDSGLFGDRDRRFGDRGSDKE